MIDIIYSAANNAEIHNARHQGKQWISVVSIDGTILELLSSEIVGIGRSTPESRRILNAHSERFEVIDGESDEPDEPWRPTR